MQNESTYIDPKESTSSSSISSKVSFDSVEIREYSRCLGDNPAVTDDGIPLSLDWEYSATGIFTLDEYEKIHPAVRRKPKEMRIGSDKREKIIRLHTDATNQDIHNVKAELRTAQHKRKVSIALQDFEPHIMLYESILRKISRIKSGVSKKREQELLWEHALLRKKAQQKIDKSTNLDDDTMEDSCSTSSFETVLQQHVAR